MLPITEKTEKSLKYSIFDGSANAAMAGLTQDYIAPLALAFKAAASQIGLLACIPNLAMAFSQLFTPLLAEKAGSRKKLVLFSSGIHALMWLPILALLFFLPGNKVCWLIALFTLTTIFGSLGNPAWGSMMADLVPEEIRGRYFGTRGRICGFITLYFFILGGVTLQYFSHSLVTGFAVLFSGAFVFRLISWFFLSRQYEPPMQTASIHSGMTELLGTLFKSNLGKFALYVALINLATNIAGPFFAVYMLRDLGFDYFTFVLVTAASTLTNLMFLTYWGKRTDKAGNIFILKITSALVPIAPLLWMFNTHIWYLLLVQVIAGFAWSGFNLASSNFVYDAAPSEKRTRYIAIFNALNGCGICFGALLGGVLISYLPALFGHTFFGLLIISGVTRGVVAVFLIRDISEVRHLSGINTAADLLFHLNLAGHKAGKNRTAQPIESNGVNDTLLTK
jgi:MFS family permease